MYWGDVRYPLLELLVDLIPSKRTALLFNWLYPIVQNLVIFRGELISVRSLSLGCTSNWPDTAGGRPSAKFFDIQKLSCPDTAFNESERIATLHVMRMNIACPPRVGQTY